jgi:hypothetical protein
MYADEIVENAWMRARARCECERRAHPHPRRCNHPLVWENRGQATTLGGWQAYVTGDPQLGGWEAVNQCEILCWACYTAVQGTAGLQPPSGDGPHNTPRWRQGSPPADQS